MNQPLVSVCIITYNHARFITACIESVLQQETSCELEILIGDNSSSDGTSEICAEYAAKYPGKIRHLLHDRSDMIVINGNTTGRRNVIRTLSEARGKYIALLEGDDYWTYTQKLETQIRFLEENPSYAMSCTNALMIDENGEAFDGQPKPEPETSDVVALSRRNFVYTASVVYRAEHVKQALSGLYPSVPAGDYFLHLSCAKHGLIRNYPERMVAYRTHPQGIWTGKSIVFQRVNLVQTISALMKELSGNSEAVAALAETRNHHIDFVFHQEDFDPEQTLKTTDDKVFTEELKKEYDAFIRKKKGLDYQPSLAEKVKNRLSGFFSGSGKKKKRD